MRFEIQKLAKSAQAAQNAKNFSKAKNLLRKALAKDPENFDIRRSYANSLFTNGEFRESAHEFHNLHLEQPADRSIWHGCAVSYLRLGDFNLASQFLKKMVAANPSDYDAWMNLCHAAGNSGKHSDCLFYAMQALQLRPLEPRAHNNLGSALLQMQRLNEALISFETARTLAPKSIDALSNIATALSMLGRNDEAIRTYEECIDLCGSDQELASSIRYRMSFDLFRTSQVKRGWDMYEHGFVPLDSRSRHPKRKFVMPRWEGQPLDSKTLLIWREQGLGDELVFLGVLHEVCERVNNVIVECDGRLIRPLARAFPKVTFREPGYRPFPSMEAIHSDFDYQIPMGSMMRLFRPDIDSFRATRPLIKPDSLKAADFKKRLEALPEKINIGLCWRSGMLNPERNHFYTSVSDWEPLLRLKGSNIINLQYGDCREELQNVKEHFGITIHHWPDLDLRDDLDGVFALLSTLDHVVTVDTSVSAMAPAVGTATSVLCAENNWMMFGGDEYLIYPGIKAYTNRNNEPLRDRIPDIVEDLRVRLGLD